MLCYLHGFFIPRQVWYTGVLPVLLNHKLWSKISCLGILEAELSLVTPLPEVICKTRMYSGTSFSAHHLQFDIKPNDDHTCCINGCVLEIKQSRLRNQNFHQMFIFDLPQCVTLLINKLRPGECHEYPRLPSPHKNNRMHSTWSQYLVRNLLIVRDAESTKIATEPKIQGRNSAFPTCIC